MDVSIQLDHGTSFTQWDKGRYIHIIGYEQTADVKVHYTTSASGVAFVVLPIWDTEVGMWRAGVPNTILTEGRSVNVYLYDEDLEVNRTVYKYTVPVDPREKPEDYIFDSFEDNALIWPYEENIEAILRREQERITAESVRSQSETLRLQNESTRESNETGRQQAEQIRVQNEQTRQRLLAELQNDLKLCKDIQKEIAGARGEYKTLGERLDQIDDTDAVTNARIEEDGSLIIVFADGHEVNIGQIPVGGSSGQQIIDIRKTDGDGSAGSLDVYTIYLDTGDTYQFSVQNGKDGAPGKNGSNGEKGESGVFIGEEEPGKDYDVWIDTDGESDVGIKGVTFTPHVDSDGNLSWTNDSNGEMSNPETVNIRGPKGHTYTPIVSSSGNLSWSNDGDLPNPSSVNLKGASGVFVGSETPSDEYDVWVSPGGGVSSLKGATFTPHVSSDGTLSWTNDQELDNPDPVNIRGDNGKDGTTYTPSMTKDGTLSWTNDGEASNPDPVNLRGPIGYVFTPIVDREGNISWTNDGNLQNPATRNIRGPQGIAGVIFTPSVDASGNLSWSNNGGLANPQTINIRGPEGPSGGGDADTLEGHPSSYFATASHDHDDATQSAHGFLSVNDKVKIDTMSQSGAQDVGRGASPTFGTVTADVVVGAVYM